VYCLEYFAVIWIVHLKCDSKLLAGIGAIREADLGASKGTFGVNSENWCRCSRTRPTRWLALLWRVTNEGDFLAR